MGQPGVSQNAGVLVVLVKFGPVWVLTHCGLVMQHGTGSALPQVMACYLGAVSIRKTVLLGMAIPMLKIRRPTGRLIFNMGIPIPGKTVFLIETGPWWHQAVTVTWTNIDFSLVSFCVIYMKAILQWMPKLIFCIMSLKFIISKLIWHLPVNTLFGEPAEN